MVIFIKSDLISALEQHKLAVGGVREILGYISLLVLPFYLGGLCHKRMVLYFDELRYYCVNCFFLFPISNWMYHFWRWGLRQLFCRLASISSRLT